MNEPIYLRSKLSKKYYAFTNEYLDYMGVVRFDNVRDEIYAKRAVNEALLEYDFVKIKAEYKNDD